MYILGIARLAPGQRCQGVHSAFDRQESLLWSIFDFADDVFTAHIMDCVACAIPRKLSAHSAGLGFQPGEMSLCRVSPRVAHAVLSDLYCPKGAEEAMSGFELAHSWGCQNPMTSRCIFVPVQLTDALFSDGCRFNRFMMTARSSQKSGHLFANWPGVEFMRVRRVAYHRPCALDINEAIENLHELEQDLVRWGPGIVESEALSVSESFTTARLTRHIELCRSLRAQMAGDIDSQ